MYKPSNYGSQFFAAALAFAVSLSLAAVTVAPQHDADRSVETVAAEMIA